MRKLILVLAALAVSGVIFAQDASPAATAQDAAAKAQEEKAKTLYTLGYLMGNTVKNQLVIQNEDEYKYISQGMRDSLTNKPSQTDVESYKPAVIKRYQDDGKKISDKRLADNKKFLDAAKKERNTKELDSGVLVITLVKGTGASPSVSSLVKVNYKSTLIDGTVFDGTDISGKPAEFSLNQVVPCWTKGLQEMKAGGKARLVCPPETAYGNRAVGAIPPNSVLIFEIELLDVK